MAVLTVVAFVLLVAGIVASAVPNVPGPLISLAGVYSYWWASGFTEPTTGLLALITVAGVLAAIGGLFEEVIAARIDEASAWTAPMAGLVGFVCFLVLGTVAMVVGAAVTAFALEYRRNRTVRAGATAAIAVILSTLGWTVVSVLLTTAIFVVMLAIVLF